MAIQRVIAMSKETYAQSGQADAPPGEAEYNAVYAAVTATERGRWFLAEFANRNRKADTDVILAAIARIDAAVRAGAAPPAALQREALVTTLATAAAAVEVAPAPTGGRDEPSVDEGTARVVAPNPSPAGADQEGGDANALSDQDYSDAVAAIAASLTTRLEESAKSAVEEAVAETLEPQAIPVAAEIVKPAAEAIRQTRVPQDNSPRWHIESPDFVFGADPDEVMAGAQPQRETAQMQSQLLGAEIMSAEIGSTQIIAEPVEARSAAAEEPQPVLSAETVFDAPAPVAVEEAAPTPTSSEAVASAANASAALEIVPLTEMARPQLRGAREAVQNQRPPRYGSLTVTDALSEDEVIALFG
ncbi:MAG TPA: hypothetical protein VMA30_07045 [Xanthobacteraceae bacterium]|nr:hypothetical protein [Xanthobacteraceae bacterium]